MPRELYTTIYRSGGWMNAKWHRTFTATSYEKAQADAEYTTRQGYKSMVWRVDMLEAIGLPVGFCRHADAATGCMAEKTCDCV